MNIRSERFVPILFLSRKTAARSGTLQNRGCHQSALKKSPRKKLSHARVSPHPGQGMPKIPRT